MNEFDLRLQNALAKRKAGQDALQSFQTPQGQMVGGVYIKPSISDSLIQGLRMYSGKKDAESADQEIKDVMQQRTESTNKALAEFLRNSKGTPANAPQDGVGPVMPAQAPNMEAAYGALMQSPDLRQMGQQGMMQLPQIEAQKQEREDVKLFRQQEAQAQRDARAQELQMRMQDQRASQQERLAAQKELREMQIQAQRDTQRMIASNRPDRQVQTMPTDAGMLERGPDGKWRPITIDGKPVMPKGAGAAGVPAGAKTQDARDALATIDMAEKLIGEATGSGIGSAIDTTAAFFGKSTKGAQAAAQLKALEGDLVAKMPKMSGPQSDKDVLLYRQMAGQIGDPSVPQETKRAALVSIREMQNRYASGGAGATGSWEAPAAPKARMKFDAQGNPIQ